MSASGAIQCHPLSVKRGNALAGDSAGAVACLRASLVLEWLRFAADNTFNGMDVGILW